MTNRVDGPRLVTGAARYSGDHPVDGLVHGYLVLSTIANGTIRTMSADAALAAPGVLAVFTPFNPLRYAGPWAQGPGYYLYGPNRFPLQPGDREVRHHGQVIGLIIAETFEQARDAAALVDTAYDARRPNTSFADGIPNAVVPPPLTGPPVADVLEPRFGSIDAALADSAVTVRTSYSQRPEHHNPMEPHTAIAAWDADGKLTIHSGTQGPLLHAQEIAVAMEVEAAAVRVISTHVGGAFGGKASTWPPAVLAAAAARQVRRPVKLALTREQLYSVTGHRPAVVQDVALGAARNGKLRAIKHDCVSTRSNVSSLYNGVSGYSLGVYKAPNVHTGTKVVTLDMPPATIMRAPGEEAGSFGLECAMDELAHALALDPVALRLANDTDRHPTNGGPYSSKHLAECLQLGAARFGWSRRKAEPRSVVEGEWLVGYGMAAGVYGANRYEMTMRVAFRNDGTVHVGAATSDMGTGMRTVLAITAADSLGMPLARVVSVLGDTRLSPDPMSIGAMAGAVGSAGSSSVAPAIRAAAKAATDALILRATQHERSPFHGLAPEEVSYRDGVLSANGRSIEFGRLLTVMDVDGVTASGTSTPEATPSHAMSSFAAHFSEVRVNRFTGETRVARMTSVVDAGTILNPAAARSQIIGGVVWGLGQALLEGAEVEPATGRIANANFADYLIPTNADIPDIDVHFLNYPDTIFNPVGSRGLGEIGTVGSAAAIANAVFNATGVRVRDLPISPEKLLPASEE
ncbi:xanthine dehydrogenase family protein molybdopterin-binding subunit [Nonomuraea sp. NPDC049784]|uniref:xanthine dehydrogenase family protein molybdopterin-binding subunit n=1 Tax=Nonomuraea sp. NPDC049784 TaxID=3154361 RepID=UPI0033DE05DD